MPFLAQETVPISDQDICSWIFDDPSYDQDKPIYVDVANPSTTISHRQAKSLVMKLIAGFRRAGLKAGDCVCIHAFNNVYTPIIVLAIMGAGGVFTGTNPAYAQLELIHHLTITQARFVIVEPDLLPPILSATASAQIPNSNLFILSPDPKDTLPSWTTLLNAGEAPWHRFTSHKLSTTTTAMYWSTSGTTGLPKAAQISHHNLVAQHRLVWEQTTTPYRVRTLIVLPMFHGAIIPLCHIAALKAGFVTHIMRRFELEPFLDAVQRFAITDLILVPPVVVRVVMSPVTKRFSLGSLRRVMIGAAPLDVGVQRRFAELAPGMTATQGYGMSESTCLISLTPYPTRDLSGSVGKMVPNVDFKIVDDDGQEVTEPGVRGELCFRGPIIVRGYLNNPTANRQSFDDDGYYHSGDIGYVEEGTGNLFLVDRKKELIKVRGFQVAPIEIEGVLLSHPGITDAAVIGVTSAANLETELPRGFVVLKEGVKLSEAEVVEYAGSKLAKYKRLEGGVRFLKEIPKTASGKILKRVLRDEAAKEVDPSRPKL